MPVTARFSMGTGAVSSRNSTVDGWALGSPRQTALDAETQNAELRKKLELATDEIDALRQELAKQPKVDSRKVLDDFKKPIEDTTKLISDFVMERKVPHQVLCEEGSEGPGVGRARKVGMSRNGSCDRLRGKRAYHRDAHHPRAPQSSRGRRRPA